jgi:hypothetical protein
MIKLRVIVSILSVMVPATAWGLFQISAQLSERDFIAAFVFGAMGIGGLAASWLAK